MHPVCSVYHALLLFLKQFGRFKMLQYMSILNVVQHLFSVILFLAEGSMRSGRGARPRNQGSVQSYMAICDESVCLSVCGAFSCLSD